MGRAPLSILKAQTLRVLRRTTCRCTTSSRIVNFVRCISRRNLTGGSHHGAAFFLCKRRTKIAGSSDATAEWFVDFSAGRPTRYEVRTVLSVSCTARHIFENLIPASFSIIRCKTERHPCDSPRSAWPSYVLPRLSSLRKSQTVQQVKKP